MFIISGFNIAIAASLFTAVYSFQLEILSTAASGAFSYKLGNGTYYSPATPIVVRCFEGRIHGLSTQLPLTVLKTNETEITADVLKSLVTAYATLDDVWTEDFLTDAVVLSAPNGAVLDDSAGSWLTSLGIKYILPSIGLEISCLSSSGVNALFHPPTWNLQPGPYILSVAPSGITITETYGLHRDKLEAFLFGVTPVPGSSAYEPVDLFIPSYQDAWIPVPSRLYSLDDDRPLAGIRVALKDIYDLEGVQTGGGSRSYAEVYPIANATAVTMQKMLSFGAVIVVSFDSQCPRNKAAQIMLIYICLPPGQDKDFAIRTRGRHFYIRRHSCLPLLTYITG